MLKDLLNDKSLNAKSKTETLCQWLTDETLKVEELLLFAASAKDPVKASCVEALEHASRAHPEIATPRSFEFAVACLGEKAPRLKMESGRLIGNIAHLFPGQLDEAIIRLLDNAGHEGTVVRWSAAVALAAIVKMGTSHNEELLPALESICLGEPKNSIRKIYLAAFRKAQHA